MARFILGELVEGELAEIWDYIALDNPDAADRFVEAAYQTFRDLARTPEMGQQSKFVRDRLCGMRSFRVRGFENWLIFYGPIPDGIEVLHIYHGARDLKGLWDAD